MASLSIWPGDTSPLYENISTIRKNLIEHSERLFVKELPVDVEVGVIDGNGFQHCPLESEDEVCRYFENLEKERKPIAMQNTALIALSGLFCILRPGYNWSPLLITRNGMLSLLSTLDVFPSFSRHLNVFGLKDFPKDEGFGGYEASIIPNSAGKLSSLESCYLLKHVEISQEVKKPGQNPWSLRHTIVYQKLAFEKKRSDHVIVRPSAEVDERLNRCLSSGTEAALGFLERWTDIHLLCVSSVDEGWRKYINYLDREVDKIFERVVMSGVDPSKLKQIDTAESVAKDMKALQYLTDQALRTAHMIDINIETINCMSTMMTKIHQQYPESCTGANMPSFLEHLRRVKQEHGFHHKNVSSLCNRAVVLSGQMRDTVSLRNSELSNQNTIAILGLSDRASQETHVVKTLTVLALIFVPASFAADFLQMGYISVVQDTKFTLAATPDLQIYAALAIPLVGLTMLIYTAVEYRKQRELKNRIIAHTKSTV